MNGEARKARWTNQGEVRLHTVDTMTGEECTVDVSVDVLDGPSLAKAWDAQDPDDVSRTECLFFVLSEGGTCGAFVLRQYDGYSHELVAGNFYTVFSKEVLG